MGQISQKYWGSIFPTPRPRFMTSFQNDRYQYIRNHVFRHNVGSIIARVTILMSIPMFLSMRNPMVHVSQTFQN